MAKTLEKRLKISSDTQGIENVKQGFSDLENSSKLLIARFTTFAAKIKAITDETDKLATYQRLLGTTFGENVTNVTRYADALADMTGIAEADIYRQTALFGQTANSLGLAAETAELYSKNLTTLSSKLAILYNIDFAQASKALRDAAKGESSTLATLTGIIVKNTSLRDELYRLGINREVSSLNNAERAILQYITVSRQMQNTDNATALAVNSVAYQKQLLAQQVRRLAAAFGKVLYPVLQAILPIYNAILMVITNIIEIFARLIGYKGDLVDTTSSISTGIDNIGKSASGVAKSLNTSLRSFDKLNNIKTPKDTSYSGGGGFGIDPRLQDEFAKMNQEMLNIRNRATEIADKIMEWLGFAKNVNGEWEFSEFKLGTLVGLLVGTGGVVWAVSKVLKIIKLIKDIGLFKTALGALTKVAGGISLIIFGIYEVFKGIQEIKMGDYFNGILDIIIGIAGAVAGVAILLGAWPVAIIAGIVLVVAEIVKHWEEIKKFLGTIASWFDNNVIQPILKFLSPVTSWVYNNIIEPIIKFISKVIDVIGSIVGKVWEVFTKLVEIYIALGKAFYNYIIKPIVNVFANIGKWVQEHIITPVWDKVKWLKDKVVGIFKGIGTIVVDFIGGVLRSVINGVLNGIEKTINGFLKLLNKAINLINEIPGVNIKPVKLLSIPKFIDGGFPEDGLFYANHNELVGKFNNGRTAVANNEDISKGIEQASFQGMMKALNASGGRTQKVEITAEGDASGLLDFITFKQKQANRRNGL